MSFKSLKFALVAASICAAAAPLCAADRTIVSDYTLTADETVDGTLSVAPGVTVDLNGHNLTASALADGATLDLSENTGTFSLDGAIDSRKISFADGATIALKLGARRSPTKIVGWTTAPSNLDTLTFVRSAEDSGSRYRIVKKDDGIYIRTGFMIIVK